MLGFLFRNAKTADTYSYRMVIHIDGEPRRDVHDVEGDFTLEGDETVEDARVKVLDGCYEQLGVGFSVISFDYW